MGAMMETANGTAGAAAAPEPLAQVPLAHYEALVRESERLRARLDAETGGAGCLADEVAALREEVAALRDEASALRAEGGELKARTDEAGALAAGAMQRVKRAEVEIADLAALAEGAMEQTGPEGGAEAGAQKEKKDRKRGVRVDDGTIRALHEAGWSPAEIADEIGSAAATVRKHLAAMGLSPGAEGAAG